MFDVRGSRRNGELLAICSECIGVTDPDRPTLSISIKRKWCYCFRCGYNRKISDQESKVVASYDNSGRYRDNIGHFLQKATRNSGHDDAKRVGLLRADPGDSSILCQGVRTYVQSRGVNPDRYPLFYSPQLPFYAIWGIKTSDGDDTNWDYWQGRAIKPDMRPKTICPTVEDKGYFAIFAGPTNPHQIIICEGVFDAIKSAMKGRTCIALLGSHVKQTQLYPLANILRGYPGDVVVFLDSDVPDRAVKVGYDLLRNCLIPQVRVVDWQGHAGDPDSVAPELREQLIAQSTILH